MKACLQMDDGAVAADHARVIDIDFITGHATGFDDLAADLRKVFTPTPRSSARDTDLHFS